MTKNVLNQAKLEVNGKKIETVISDRYEKINFICKVQVGRGKYDQVATQQCSNLIQHIGLCNKQGWEVLSVVMQKPDVLKIAKTWMPQSI